jgi:adenylate cyclase
MTESRVPSAGGSAAAAYRVLMLDDQRLVGTLFRRILAAHPEFLLEFHTDPATALAAAEAFRPTVILQDLVMDEIDGLEMVRRWRAQPATATVPVIMLSAMEGGEVKAELLESGANDYLVKPPSEVELIARLRVHSDAHLSRLERDAAFRELEAEREKSERLLLNILPATIARRLKDQERTIADSFPAVTVFFSDLAGFTQFSQTVDAPHLVGLLDRIFSLFDRLAGEHGVEKIKTIGDAYMAVAGLPEPRPDHAEAVAAMALGMRDGFAALMREVGLELGVRIGIHSGPVVAGVIGTHKFTYDLWGDTVNIASRMESHGEPGKIHVSEATRGLLEGKFAFVDRGEVQVKGKGAMRTSFLLGPA